MDGIGDLMLAAAVVPFGSPNDSGDCSRGGGANSGEGGGLLRGHAYDLSEGGAADHLSPPRRPSQTVPPAAPRHRWQRSRWEKMIAAVTPPLTTMMAGKKRGWTRRVALVMTMIGTFKRAGAAYEKEDLESCVNVPTGIKWKRM